MGYRLFCFRINSGGSAPDDISAVMDSTLYMIPMTIASGWTKVAILRRLSMGHVPGRIAI